MAEEQTVVIRPASVTDFEAVTGLYPSDTDYIRTVYHHLCHSRDSHHFVAEVDAVVVGYLVVSDLVTDQTFIGSSLRVAPGFQSKGIGLRLVRHQFTVGEHIRKRAPNFLGIVGKSTFHQKNTEQGMNKIIQKWGRREYQFSAAEFGGFPISSRRPAESRTGFRLLTPANLGRFMDRRYSALEPLLRKHHNCLNYGFPKKPLSVSRANLREAVLNAQTGYSEQGVGELTGFSFRDVIMVPAGLRCDVTFFGDCQHVCLDHVLGLVTPLLVAKNWPKIILTVRIPMDMMTFSEGIDAAFGSSFVSSIETWLMDIINEPTIRFFDHGIKNIY